jgi:hypothetical protein
MSPGTAIPDAKERVLSGEVARLPLPAASTPRVGSTKMSPAAVRGERATRKEMEERKGIRMTWMSRGERRREIRAV